VTFAALAGDLAERGIDLTDRRRVDPVVVEHIESGRRISAVEAKRDDLLRTRVLGGFLAAFDQVDVVLSPTVGVAGVSNREAIEQGGPATVEGRAVDPYLGWVLTVPVNFCGFPAASVPAGQVGGLPVGLQVIAPHGREDLCLRVVAALEQALPWRSSYGITGSSM